MDRQCDICDEKINVSSLSFLCEFCQKWFHHCCNLPYFPNTQIDVGSCLKCNSEILPLSICHDINNQDKSFNYLHCQYRSLIPFEKQSYETNLDINCRYIDCDDFKSTYSPKSSRYLSFLHLNICSLSKDFDMLKCFLDSLEFDFGVTGISETRILNSSIPDNFNLLNYTPFFRKTEAAAWGTGLYISNDLTFKPRQDLSKKLYSAKKLKTTFCELIMKNQTNVIVGCIYKDPHMDIDNFSKNYISPFLQQISKENKRLVLLGDFNINLLNFNDVDSVKNFVDTLESSFLLPSISLPTRVTATSSTLIDNIFFSLSKYKVSSRNLLIGISDHLPQYLIFEQNTYACTSKPIQYIDWKKFDKDRFTSDFRNIDWNNLLSLGLQDPDTAFNNFFNSVNALVDQHVPIKTLLKRKIKKSSKPWITKGIRVSIKVRDKLPASYIKEKNEALRSLCNKNIDFIGIKS